jgi:hypothetical protein
MVSIMHSRKTDYPESLFVSGHRACHGCGMALAVRHVLQATGKNVIVVTPTGCLETFTSPYGFSPWKVPWIHHLFENGPAVASGVAAALKAQGRDDTRVVVIAGDGSTFDIGFGALSGMLERGDDVLYICTDNAAYMNTGGQRSADLCGNDHASRRPDIHGQTPDQKGSAFDCRCPRHPLCGQRFGRIFEGFKKESQKIHGRPGAALYTDRHALPLGMEFSFSLNP